MENNLIEINLLNKLEKIWFNRKIIFISIPIGIIIGLIVAFSIPKTYEVETIISPESGKSNNNSNLSGVASMLGINSSGLEEDALNANMIPEIIRSTPFILELFNVKIETSKDSTMYFHDYLKQEKEIWWSYIFKMPKSFIKIFSKNNDKEDTTSINPFKLSHSQYSIIEKIKNITSANIDKDSKMTKIKVKCQDPKVAAIISDSITNKIQEYIINYKTKKAKEDYTFLHELCQKRKNEYYTAQLNYSFFLDSNKNIITQNAKSTQERLLNELNISQQAYLQLKSQLLVASAKVQEAKPVFVVLEPPTIPIIPKFPNKTLLVIIFTFLIPLLYIIWIVFLENIYITIKQELTKLYCKEDNTSKE